MRISDWSSDVCSSDLPDGSVRRKATANYKGVAVAWDDPPYGWVVERDFRQTRVFQRGPLAYLSPSLELETTADGNSRVTYRLEGVPHGIVGHLLFATGLLDKIGRGLETMVRHAGDFARGAAAMPFEYTPAPLGREQQERLAGLTRQLAARPSAHDLADRPAAPSTHAHAVAPVRIHPPLLARDSQRPVRP